MPASNEYLQMFNSPSPFQASGQPQVSSPRPAASTSGDPATGFGVRDPGSLPMSDSLRSKLLPGTMSNADAATRKKALEIGEAGQRRAAELTTLTEAEPNPNAPPRGGGSGGGAGGIAAAPKDWDAEAAARLGIGSPEEQAALAKRRGIQREGMDIGLQGLDAARENGAQQVARYNAMAQESEHGKQEEIRRASLQRDAEQAKASEIRRYMDDAAKDRIDPNGRRSTFQTALGALGAALGGIGQVYGHTKDNAALDMINNNINRDVEAQRADHQMKKERVEGLRSDYSELRQRGLDDASAAAGARQIQLEGHVAALKGLMASSDNDKIQTNGRMAINGLSERIATEDMDRVRGIKSMAYQLAHPTVTGGGGAGAAKAGGGEDPKDAAADAAADYLIDHPKDVEGAHSLYGRLLNSAATPGKDEGVLGSLVTAGARGLQSDEDRGVRRAEDKVIGGQLVGRVNDERIKNYGARVISAKDALALAETQKADAARRAGDKPVKGGGKGGGKGGRSGADAVEKRLERDEDRD
jgi:hypothetical protein